MSARVLAVLLCLSCNLDEQYEEPNEKVCRAPRPLMLLRFAVACDSVIMSMHAV